VLGVTESEAIPHASELPLLICAAVMLAVPDEFRFTVIFWQTAIGGVMSFTVTVAVQDEVFPFTSIAVSVTVFAPTFEQLKDEGVTVSEANPHEALEPLFTCAAVILTVPPALRFTVIFWQTTEGRTLFWTVTVAAQVETFPLLSVTVSVTVFAPTFVQLNVEGETESEAIPQLSKLPLLICAAVIEPAPAGFNWIVMFWQIAVGAILSTTVTVAVQVETFPFTSVTVSVTVFAPTLEQLNVFGVTDSEAIPHASELPLLICAAVILAVPEEFRFIVMFWQIAVGSTLSWTVTVARHVETFPFTSVTVSVTVFAPTLEQLNVFGETDNEAIPQLSVEPPSTSIASIDVFPLASNWTVIFWQTAVGAMLSTTVTVDVQVETFPFTSVTVSVTVFAPTFAQVNELGETVIEAIPQLSKLPLLIWAAVMLAVPAAFKFTVRFWQSAVGAMFSWTVTVALQVDEFPLPSVTVKVTVLAPTLAHVNDEGETVIEAMLQLSVEPLLICAAVMLAVPPAFSWIVIFWQSAVGAMLSTTVTTAVQVEIFPFTSVTLNVTLLVPMLAQVNVFGETESEAIPHASELPLFTCAAVILAVPAVFSWTVIFWQTAVGGVTSLTVTVALQVAEFPFSSVTVKVTVLAPTFAHVNAEGETVIEVIPHASELPLSIWEARIVAVPDEFKSMLIFWHKAIGSTLSWTVTVAVQVATFPFTSVTVSVTGFGPTPAQVNEFGETDNEAIPQLSVLPLLICAAVMETFPVASNWTVIFWQIAVGGMMSFTVTVAVQVAVFPLWSVTVNVTVFAPTLEQLKVEGETDKDVTEQLSVEPLFSWAAVILAVPDKFKSTEIFWQMAVGATLSITVTVAVQVAVFPFTSVTVKVTVLAPKSEQSNEEGETDNEAIPQLSELPLFTCAAVTLAFPDASKATVTFWQIAVGGIISLTVTIPAQVAVFPFTSVTVSVTVFAPTLEQLKVEGETESDKIPQASELPLFTCAAVMLAVPDELRFTVTFWQTAVGGVISLTVTVAVQVDVFPLLSVTVRVTVFAPTLEQVNEEGETDNEAIPHASELPLFTCAAVIVAAPDELRFIEIFWQTAVGAVLSITVTVAVQVEVFPFASVTVKVTVFAPTLAHVNAEGETDSEAIPQASVEPLLTCAAVMVALPDELRFTEIFWQMAVGAVTSTTVTVAVQVEVFPFTSVTVSVTVFAPTLAHVNVEGETESEAIPQASELPLLTCAAVIVAFPAELRFTVIFWQTAVGATLSWIVTVAVQVDEFPFTSVTVSVTVFAPISEQSNEEGETESEAIPQASLEPLFTCAAVIAAVPAAFNWTVIFWQIAVGGVTSTTVTVAVQVDEFPLPSVTVSVTVLAPTLAQVNDDGDTLNVTAPQTSELPLFTWAAVMVAVPEELRLTVIFWQLATGGVTSTIVTVAVQVDEFPFTSVTVSVTLLNPRLAQVKVEGETE
jgi:hypothetical protein